MSRLLDRYLAVIDVDESTMTGYRGYIENHIENHIRPVLGDLPVSRVDGEVLDSFYAELRWCRRRCKTRRGLVDHRTTADHECDGRCLPHVCQPLAPATVRQIHWILSGAFDRAVRWRWISVTPSGSAEPPPPPRSKPRAAVGRRGRADRGRGVERRRLGHVRVDGYDDWRPPG